MIAPAATISSSELIEFRLTITVDDCGATPTPTLRYTHTPIRRFHLRLTHFKKKIFRFAYLNIGGYRKKCVCWRLAKSRTGIVLWIWTVPYAKRGNRQQRSESKGEWA